MAKKKKPPSISKLTKKIDTLFSRIIRIRAIASDGLVKCITCTHRAPFDRGMQAGHYLARQHKITRWEYFNVHPQCYACNVFYGGRPQEYRHQLVLLYGEERVNEIDELRHKHKIFTRAELEAKVDELTAVLKELEAGV